MGDNSLKYEYTENGVKVISGTAYIAYICVGGSGFDIAVVENGEWREGADEIIAVCESKAAADEAITKYIGLNH